jgi:hypothetical protein
LRLTGLKPDPAITEASFKLNKNLYHIGDSAFNQSFSGYRSAIVIYIPSSVERMDKMSISNLDIRNSSIVIGSPSDYSKLDFTKSYADDKYIIRHDAGRISSIEFYS